MFNFLAIGGGLSIFNENQKKNLNTHVPWTANNFC